MEGESSNKKEEGEVGIFAEESLSHVDSDMTDYIQRKGNYSRRNDNAAAQ